MADLRGAGCVRHIWVTIASNEPDYLRKLVFRAYWDGESAPSIESPVGDFFGVGHAPRLQLLVFAAQYGDRLQR